MEKYVDIYSLGEVQAIGDLNCIPVLLDEYTLQGASWANYWDPAKLEADGTLEKTFKDTSIFSKLDFNTPNGTHIKNHIFRSGSFIEKIVNKYTETNNYTVKAYLFILPDLVVDKDTYNTIQYQQRIADTFFSDYGATLYIQSLFRWMMFGHQDWYSKLRGAQNAHLTWIYQETTDTYIPALCLKAYLIGTSESGLLDEAGKASLRFDSCDVIKADADFRTYEIGGSKEKGFWYFTINADITAVTTISGLETDELEVNRDIGYNRVTDIKAKNYNGKYSVPANPNDLYARTVCFRTHVTYWGADGMPKPINEKYCKYLDPNCYAYTQPVWRLPVDGSEESNKYLESFKSKVKNSTFCDGAFNNISFDKIPVDLRAGWKNLLDKGNLDKFNNEIGVFNLNHWCGYFDLNNNLNYGVDANGVPCTVKDETESWLIKKGFLSVSAAWFSEDAGRMIYVPNCTVNTSPYSNTPTPLWVYTKVPNGLGHNPENGDTIGMEAEWCYDFPNGIEAIGLRPVNRATQSAVCFTNLLNFGANGYQTTIEAYTEGDDFEPTIINGDTPSISLSVKGQNVGRMNLETNNVMTRW